MMYKNFNKQFSMQKKKTKEWESIKNKQKEWKALKTCSAPASGSQAMPIKTKKESLSISLCVGIQTTILSARSISTPHSYF